MRRLLTRVLLAVFLASIPACSNTSSSADKAAIVYHEIVPTDPTSIARWEGSEFNTFGSKIKVVSLMCFRDKMTEKGHAEAKPVAVEMSGALTAGVEGEQGEALRRFTTAESELYSKARVAIYDEYRKNYPTYKQALTMGASMFGADESEVLKMLPEVIEGNELDGLISFETLYVSRPENGVSRIGVVLSCPWDEEHGMGVVIADSEVERVGDAGAALLGVMPNSGNGSGQR